MYTMVIVTQIVGAQIALKMITRLQKYMWATLGVKLAWLGESFGLSCVVTVVFWLFGV